jgi:hypothetical protein
MPQTADAAILAVSEGLAHRMTEVNAIYERLSTLLDE